MRGLRLPPGSQRFPPGGAASGSALHSSQASNNAVSSVGGGDRRHQISLEVREGREERVNEIIVGDVWKKALCRYLWDQGWCF